MRVLGLVMILIVLIPLGLASWASFNIIWFEMSFLVITMTKIILRGSFIYLFINSAGIRASSFICTLLGWWIRPGKSTRVKWGKFRPEISNYKISREKLLLPVRPMYVLASEIRSEISAWLIEDLSNNNRLDTCSWLTLVSLAGISFTAASLWLARRKMTSVVNRVHNASSTGNCTPNIASSTELLPKLWFLQIMSWGRDT